MCITFIYIYSLMELQFDGVTTKSATYVNQLNQPFLKVILTILAIWVLCYFLFCFETESCYVAQGGGFCYFLFCFETESCYVAQGGVQRCVILAHCNLCLLGSSDSLASAS